MRASATHAMLRAYMGMFGEVAKIITKGKIATPDIPVSVR